MLRDHDRCTFRSVTKSVVAAMAVAAIALGLTAAHVSAQIMSPQRDSELAQCETITSLEKRLQLERWAPRGECDRPTRARITDNFLGYSCLTEGGIDSCRAFVPKPGSRNLDTAKGFRCLDLSMTLTSEGDFLVHRLREWATTPTECEWDPNLGLLATEVDFDANQVCAAGACIPFQQLTGIGKARLKHLVISAFRENGVTSAPNLEPRMAAPATVASGLSIRKAAR